MFIERKVTDTICLLHEATSGKPLETLWREARRKGELDVPFHFLVQASGVLETGRPLQAVAGRLYPRNESTVYILLDAKDNNTITDAQKKTLKEILKELKAKFPGVQTVKV
ncbi:hypothetical protein SPFL3102_03559 [Sporomusaceae bacterium FL31]|nr:hypothetical protein SPFL3101_00446 [Sporomusaceae bacterium FL31]GCE35708.1 hypothetical protein SPFL3102_03559 [Sporomusaceae bacterium]